MLSVAVCKCQQLHCTPFPQLIAEQLEEAGSERRFAAVLAVFTDGRPEDIRDLDMAVEAALATESLR